MCKLNEINGDAPFYGNYGITMSGTCKLPDKSFFNKCLLEIFYIQEDTGSVSDTNDLSNSW